MEGRKLALGPRGYVQLDIDAETPLAVDPYRLGLVAHGVYGDPRVAHDASLLSPRIAMPD
jgi:hypothetical protein